MIEIFFRSMIIGYSGAMMPGTLLTYTVDKSIRHGAKSGFLISLGHSALELFLVVLIFAGAGKYLSSDIAKTIIGIGGGLVLGYLGIGMLIDIYRDRIVLGGNGAQADKQGNMLIGGAVLSATNPYFIIWWAAVGLALIMNSYNSFGIKGMAIFYMGHILADITWFSFVSILISRTRNFINIKVYKVVIAILAVCLIGFGVKFFLQAI